jgi:hypothetical protein
MDFPNCIALVPCCCGLTTASPVQVSSSLLPTASVATNAKGTSDVSASMVAEIWGCEVPWIEPA